MTTKKLLKKLVCSEINVTVTEPKNFHERNPIIDPEYSKKKFTINMEFIVKGNPDKINSSEVIEYFYNKFEFGK